MDLVEDRNAAFWTAVYEHPEVRPHVAGDFDIAAVIDHPTVAAFRSAHGGYLFHRSDALGRVWDLHALYTPEGWGREACSALKLALAAIFARGAQLVTAHEVEGWWRSQPPRSFGFSAAGIFEPSDFGPLRTWVLTRTAWEASPARSRTCPSP